MQASAGGWSESPGCFISGYYSSGYDLAILSSTYISQRKPWESLWSSSVTMLLVVLFSLSDHSVIITKTVSLANLLLHLTSHLHKTNPRVLKHIPDCPHHYFLAIVTAIFYLHPVYSLLWVQRNNFLYT